MLHPSTGPFHHWPRNNTIARKYYQQINPKHRSPFADACAFQAGHGLLPATFDQGVPAIRRAIPDFKSANRKEFMIQLQF
jgi:hypothetical protein